mmetsp:Transcript_92505/g.270772  ORF Transcript_92505/g.270772 Transcript_92505/m.270772 type:complete len:212 (+) Transcript_92505:116-751(+)
MHPKRASAFQIPPMLLAHLCSTSCRLLVPELQVLERHVPPGELPGDPAVVDAPVPGGLAADDLPLRRGGLDSARAPGGGRHALLLRAAVREGALGVEARLAEAPHDGRARLEAAVGDARQAHGLRQVAAPDALRLGAALLAHPHHRRGARHDEGVQGLDGLLHGLQRLRPLPDVQAGGEGRGEASAEEQRCPGRHGMGPLTGKAWYRVPDA